MVSVLVVQPHGVVLRANGCNERLAVGRNRDSFLRCWAEGELLRLAIGKALPPDVEVIRSGGEIDPFPVGRPCAGKTSAVGRADNSNVIRALEWDNAAWENFTSITHLNDQHRSAIRRKVGMVCHASITHRHIDVAAIPSGLIRGHNLQVQPFDDLRKEQSLASFNPCQGRSVGQEQMGLATENRHLPGVEWSSDAI